MGKLKSILKSVEELTGINLVLDDLLSARFDIITVLMIRAYAKGNVFDESQTAELSSLINDILDIKLKSVKGDKTAETLFNGILKLANPPKMIRKKSNKKKPFLPIVNDMLTGFNPSPHLVRGYEIRYLMSQISSLVEPVCTCQKPKNLNDLLNEFERQKDKDAELVKHQVFEQSDFGKGFCDCSKLIPSSRIKLRLDRASIGNQSLVKEIETFFNDPNNKRKLGRLTLEGLAKKIHIYRVYEGNPNTDLTERMLDRSMQYLKEFEKDNPNEVEMSHKLPVRGGEDLNYQFLTN